MIDKYCKMKRKYLLHSLLHNAGFRPNYSKWSKFIVTSDAFLNCLQFLNINKSDGLRKLKLLINN